MLPTLLHSFAPTFPSGAANMVVAPAQAFGRKPVPRGDWKSRGSLHFPDRLCRPPGVGQVVATYGPILDRRVTAEVEFTSNAEQ